MTFKSQNHNYRFFEGKKFITKIMIDFGLTLKCDNLIKLSFINGLMGINLLGLIGRIRDKSRDFILFSINSGLLADTNYQLLVFNSFDDQNVLFRCVFFFCSTHMDSLLCNQQTCSYFESIEQRTMFTECHSSITIIIHTKKREIITIENLKTS